MNLKSIIKHIFTDGKIGVKKFEVTAQYTKGDSSA